MTTENNKLALIESSEYAPGIYYVRPEPIVIEGLEEKIAAANSEIEEYFTDDAIESITASEVKDAKALRAALNKRVQAVDARRKEVKGYYTEVLTPFELQMNKLRDTYKGASDRLNARIAEIEDGFKAQNRIAAATYYNDMVPVLAEALPYSRIADEKWHGLSFGQKKAELEIDNVVDRLIRDIATIEETCGEWTENSKVVYFDTLDLSRALAEKSRLEAIAEKTRQMDREREEIRIAQQEHADEMAAQEAEAFETPVETPLEVPAPQVRNEVPETPAEAPVSSFTLRFSGTSEDMSKFIPALKMFLAGHPEISNTQIRKA